MYEQNREPLPEGDASIVFAKQIGEIKKTAPPDTPELTHETVLRWANRDIQPIFAAIARRLLLPGSGILGIENLRELIKLAGDGNACLICLNHRSNLDVPTFLALLNDRLQGDLFDRIIWIAGRKLEEDVGMTSVLVQSFNRVIVTPHGWFRGAHSERRVREARCINIAAKRSISRMRHKGWVFALFPAGTRTRPNDRSTEEAIAETDSYLKLFDYLVLGRIDGCTMPVAMDQDLTHETPMLDRVTIVLGPVERTSQFRLDAAARYKELNHRAATAEAIIQSIMSLGSVNRHDNG